MDTSKKWKLPKLDLVKKDLNVDGPQEFVIDFDDVDHAAVKMGVTSMVRTLNSGAAWKKALEEVERLAGNDEMWEIYNVVRVALGKKPEPV